MIPNMIKGEMTIEVSFLFGAQHARTWSISTKRAIDLS